MNETRIPDEKRGTDPREKLTVYITSGILLLLVEEGDKRVDIRRRVVDLPFDNE